MWRKNFHRYVRTRLRYGSMLFTLNAGIGPSRECIDCAVNWRESNYAFHNLECILFHIAVAVAVGRLPYVSPRHSESRVAGTGPVQVLRTTPLRLNWRRGALLLELAQETSVFKVH